MDVGKTVDLVCDDIVKFKGQYQKTQIIFTIHDFNLNFCLSFLITCSYLQLFWIDLWWLII